MNLGGYHFGLDDRILKTVFIQSVASERTTAMHDVQHGMTVESFRKEHCRKQGTEAEYSRLIFSGKELEDVKNGKGKSREEGLVHLWEPRLYKLLLTSYFSLVC